MSRALARLAVAESAPTPPAESGAPLSLPYGRHTIEEDDIAAVVAAMRSELLAQGPRVAAFESALAERVGARHAVACSSGTAALHLALAGLSLKPGDVCVVPPVTFLSTATAALFCGAEVLFCDVDPTTGLMTPHALDQALRRAKDLGMRVRAVTLGEPGLNAPGGSGAPGARSPSMLAPTASSGARDVLELPFKEAKGALVEAFEREYITALLERHKGNISRAAQDAGIDRNYIHRLVKKYGLAVDRE